MKVEEIKTIAREMGVNVNRMKKPEAIRSIQRAENNIDCYATIAVESCRQHECLWKVDCSVEHKKNKSRI